MLKFSSVYGMVVGDRCFFLGVFSLLVYLLLVLFIYYFFFESLKLFGGGYKVLIFSFYIMLVI